MSMNKKSAGMTDASKRNFNPNPSNPSNKGSWGPQNQNKGTPMSTPTTGHQKHPQTGMGGGSKDPRDLRQQSGNKPTGGKNPFDKNK